MADVGLKLFMFSFCLSLLPAPGSLAGSSGEPNTYSLQVCLHYDAIQSHRYNTSVGTSTSPILDNLPHPSYWSRLPPASRLHSGEEYSKRIELSAPVISKVSPSYLAFRHRREPSKPATGERPSGPENEQCIHCVEAVQRVGTGLQRW